MAAENHDTEWGELRAEIRALNLNVTRLTDVVDKNTEQLNKVQVLENNYLHLSQALERAFSTIKSDKDTIDQRVEEQAEKNKGYDRYIWLVTGFVSAVCVFWTLMGYRINEQIDESVKALNDIRIHMAMDVMKSSQDVIKVIEEHDKGSRK